MADDAGFTRAGAAPGRREVRDATRAEMSRLARLLRAVPYDGRTCAWSSPAGRRFLTAARKVVEAGVPANRLAEALTFAAAAPVGPVTITRRLTLSAPRPPRIRAGRTHGRRDRKTPDSARVPHGTRAATPEEWACLLALHARVPTGITYATHTSAERAALTAPIQERDAEITRLWVDRVSDPHIADLLGLSDEAIKAARRRARRNSGIAPARTPKPRHRPPRATPEPIPLTEPERDLLVAAWTRVKDTGRPYVSSPHMPALARIITANRAAGVPAAAIAAALGIERGGCARLLRAYGQHQAEQAWSA